MASRGLLELVIRNESLEKASEAIQSPIAGAFDAGGPIVARLKDLLHGTWLGHPLHPVLTDVPLGAWTAAVILDAMEAFGERDDLGPASDLAVGVGLMGALGAAVTGVTDWSDTYGRGRKIGLAHGLLNATATLLYGTSLLLRHRDNRQAGIGFGMAGYAVALAAAYLGGQLVYGEQIGVDHTAAQDLAEAAKFTPVLADEELAEGEMRRVDAKGIPVLLVRHDGKVRALAHTCSHLGGPLSEGKLEGNTVRCPWHGSRFSLEDGRVCEGPATFPQPRFQTRLRKGQIEVRYTGDA
jgi:nitrite reductase/ring-hydroxylating ferredoxin subunit/uncharacterized membrane protein